MRISDWSSDVCSSDLDKDQFLRQVSHELKTPLASLREGAELLREGSLGALTPRQHEVAGILAESTIELEALISNLLAYAEWRSDRKNTQRGWFAPRPLLDEVLSTHVLQLRQRRLRHELSVPPSRFVDNGSPLRPALATLFPIETTNPQ